MGFGFLFLGYLVAFVLSMTLERLHVGGLAYLLGYALMLRGLTELTRYQKNFSYAKYLTFPLLALAGYSLLGSFDTMFYWNLPIFVSSVREVVSAVTDLLMLVFQCAVLFGIRMLAREVELLHIDTKALRNMIFVAMYAILYCVARFPVSWVGSFVGYVEYAKMLVWLVLVVCNLLLLLSCNKNICPAGDEDQPPRQSRFGFINRMNDAYNNVHQKNIDNAKRDAEAFVRRRREKKEQKNNKRKK